MQYNSHATQQDIVSQTLFLASANLSNYPLVDITRNANIAYHSFAVLVAQADGTWKWDDANNTTLPIGTTDLVASQKDYSLADTMLEVERIEIKNAAGDWIKLRPTDQTLVQEALDEYQPTSGTPNEYDKVGRSLFLYPTPSYNSTGGLKVHFKRSANIFASTDTTKSPGFSEAFHHFIPTRAARMWCMLFKPNRVNVLLAEENRILADAEAFYGRRARDERPRFTPAYQNNR